MRYCWSNDVKQTKNRFYHFIIFDSRSRTTTAIPTFLVFSLFSFVYFTVHVCCFLEFLPSHILSSSALPSAFPLSVTFPTYVSAVWFLSDLYVFPKGSHPWVPFVRVNLELNLISSQANLNSSRNLVRLLQAIECFGPCHNRRLGVACCTA